MRIFKVLNNNAVVVKEFGQEKIVMGPGIAFQKSKHDIVPESKVEKIFLLQDENERFQQLLSTLPEDRIDFAEKVISYAEGELAAPLDDHLHIALADHISFALDRLEAGYPIKNRLLSQIKVLYPEEFQIGLWAAKEMTNDFEVNVPEDEAAHIALHIHTAKTDSRSMEDTLHHAEQVDEMIRLIEGWTKVKVQQDDISHQRLLTHLNFALNRLRQGEALHGMDPDMLELIQTKYQTAFQCASEVADFMASSYQLSFPEEEKGYIALHIQRIIDKNATTSTT
ncbi:PRD domain-containing protein [Salsuginibacillus halophilus]|uniref:PRD domain-containing protein n=1 Tax=Salsuginibacillus halophilus TaxID=517424 RepID=UPI000D0D2D08|nr:PRD domain-containing protein [Salsuginibacillus halophilus]